MSDANNQAQLKINQAYEDWCATGKLTDDNAIVKALYYKFHTISVMALGVSDYYLMAKDARENASKLEDILKARGLSI